MFRKNVPLAAALGIAVALSAGMASAQTLDYQLRAAELIGKQVTNRMDQRLGTIDDLLLTREGHVSHVVIGVGGFLGIGDKLVAVPFSEIKTQGNALLLDRNADQLKAHTEFKYRQTASLGTSTRDQYIDETNRRMTEWDKRVQDWKGTAKEKSADASKKVDEAWLSTKEKFTELKNATAEGWERAKTNFEKAWNDLQTAWKDATS
jgi:sporulation protein YlmC with PRC-barrel domain